MPSASLSPFKQLISGNLDKYHDHIRGLNYVLSKELVRWNIPLKIRVKANQRMNHAIKQFVSSDEFTDHLWANQLETLAEILHKCLENPGQSGVIIGSCQLGKTMTIILCQLVAAAIFVLRGEIYRFAILVPGRESLRKQAVDDYKRFCELYDFELVNGHGPIMLSDYVHSHLHLGDEGGDIPIYPRSAGKLGLKRHQRIAAEYHEMGIKTIYLVDEYHWGEQKKGIMDQMLDEARDLDKEGTGDFVIAISATPWHLTNLSDLWKVNSRTYDGYVGYPFFQGEVFDDRYDILTPDHMGFDDERIAEKLGVKQFGDVCRNCYYNIKSYRRQINNDEDFAKRWKGKPHYAYVEFVEGKLIELINACLKTKNPLGKLGMAIRFFKSKYDVDDFVGKKDSKGVFHPGRIYDLGLDPSIRALAWQGQEARQEVGTFIKEQGVGDEPRVVFVTGSGRMGNRFDNTFGYFAEFAESSTLVALMQGLVGRSCGNKDVPMIFLCPTQAIRLTALIKYKGDLNLINGIIHHTLKKMSKGAQTVVLWAEEETPNGDNQSTLAKLGLEDLEARIQEFIDEELGERETLVGRSQDPNRFTAFWEGILNEENLSAIEDGFGAERDTLVRHTLDDELLNEDRFHDAEENAYGMTVGFRVARKEASRNSNRISSDRLADRTRKASGNRLLVPQIHVAQVPKRGKGKGFRWEFVCLKLRACRPLVWGKNILLPTEESSASGRFANPDEQGQVSIARAKGRK